MAKKILPSFATIATIYIAMKITKRQLKQIIKEELGDILRAIEGEGSEGAQAYGGRGRYMPKDELEQYLEATKDWEALRHAIDQSTFQGIGKVEDIPKGAAEMLATYLIGAGATKAVAPHLSKLKAWQKLPDWARTMHTLKKQPFQLVGKGMPRRTPELAALAGQEAGESEYEPEATIAGGPLTQIEDVPLLDLTGRSEENEAIANLLQQLKISGEF